MRLRAAHMLQHRFMGWRSWAALGTVSFAVMVLLLLASRWTQTGVILTSWASSVALLLTAPSARSTSPHRIVTCHVLSAFIGAALAVSASNSIWIIAIAVSLALLTADLLDIVHPPAIANAAIAFSVSTAMHTFLLLVLLGAVVLGTSAGIVRRLAVFNVRN
jgi:CBS-domain-containing membrane protein